jgi:hypothetical protein
MPIPILVRMLLASQYPLCLTTMGSRIRWGSWFGGRDVEEGRGLKNPSRVMSPRAFSK